MPVLDGARSSKMSPWHKNLVTLGSMTESMDMFALPKDLVTREATAASITQETDIHKTPTMCSILQEIPDVCPLPLRQ